MAEIVAVEFTDPSGEPLRIEWRAEAIAALDSTAVAPEPPWALVGDLDWDEIAALRIFSGRLADGNLIALAALRPGGAQGHGDEVVAGMLGPIGELEQLAEPLLSTEYGADQLPRRVGLELYREAGALPLRVAGDATATSAGEDGALRRTSTALELRASGEAGVGILDVLGRAS